MTPYIASHLRRTACAAALLIAVGAPPAVADQGGGSSVTEKLIDLLVQKGVLTHDQAGALLQQAQQESRAANQPPPRTAARKSGKPTATAAAGTGAATTGAATTGAATTGAAATGAAATGAAATGAAALTATTSTPADSVPPGTVRVPYIPAPVRQQIADEVRAQVMRQAKAEGWAEPNQTPEWTQRIRVFGDVRVRGEGDLFPSGNNPYVPDFQAINTGSGYDVTGQSGLPPLLDTTADRWRPRLRARLGVEAKIDDGVTSVIRIATGNDNSPVTANQTLGQNGTFAKYAIWLDEAYIKLAPTDWLTTYAGRESNPFWTSRLLFYDDLNFDGVAAQITPSIDKHWKPFLIGGIFPVYNTDFNFQSTGAPKINSDNKWLYAVQGGTEWHISDDFTAKAAAGFFSFANITGKLSTPCTLLYSSDTCDTDNTRPLFTQYGNTMFPIRDLVPNPNNPTGPQPQYFGLASSFGILDLHGRFDIDSFRPVRISLEGDYIRNLNFSHSSIAAKGPVNNLSSSGGFQGGNSGYLARVTVGTPEIAQRWDWNVSAAYEYLESDAAVAGLADPDFHLGGTNAKGYILTGALGIARNTWLALRYMAADQIAGAPYAVDVVQLDLNVRF
jgi:hypothetical protein